MPGPLPHYPTEHPPPPPSGRSMYFTPNHLGGSNIHSLNSELPLFNPPRSTATEREAGEGEGLVTIKSTWHPVGAHPLQDFQVIASCQLHRLKGWQLLVFFRCQSTAGPLRRLSQLSLNGGNDSTPHADRDDSKGAARREEGRASRSPGGGGAGSHCSAVGRGQAQETAAL